MKEKPTQRKDSGRTANAAFGSRTIWLSLYSQVLSTLGSWWWWRIIRRELSKTLGRISSIRLLSLKRVSTNSKTTSPSNNCTTKCRKKTVATKWLESSSKSTRCSLIAPNEYIFSIINDFQSSCCPSRLYWIRPTHPSRWLRHLLQNLETSRYQKTSVLDRTWNSCTTRY